MKDIKKAIYDAEIAQDKAAKDLEDAKDSNNMTQTQITKVMRSIQPLSVHHCVYPFIQSIHKWIQSTLDLEVNALCVHCGQQIETKLNETEAKLNTTRLQDLPEEIEALKMKMEMNREQAKEAKRAADKALADAKDAETVRIALTLFPTMTTQDLWQSTNSNHMLLNVFNICFVYFYFAFAVQQELPEVEDLFEVLKEKNTNQDLEDIASTRLKNITMEAEKLRKEVADKMKNIEGVVFLNHLHPV